MSLVFDLSINKEVISFNNLSGSFGEFKIGDRIFPEPFPEDNPFTKINEFNSGKKIDQFIEQGGGVFPQRLILNFTEDKRIITQNSIN